MAPKQSANNTSAEASSAPKSASPKAAAPKAASTAKDEASSAPKSASPKAAAPKTAPPNAASSGKDEASSAPKAASPKAEPPKAASPKAEPPKAEPHKAEPPKAEPHKTASSEKKEAVAEKKEAAAEKKEAKDSDSSAGSDKDSENSSSGSNKAAVDKSAKRHSQGSTPSSPSQKSPSQDGADQIVSVMLRLVGVSFLFGKEDSSPELEELLKEVVLAEASKHTSPDLHASFAVRMRLQKEVSAAADAPSVASGPSVFATCKVITPLQAPVEKIVEGLKASTSLQDKVLARLQAAESAKAGQKITTSNIKVFVEACDVEDRRAPNVPKVLDELLVHLVRKRLRGRADTTTGGMANCFNSIFIRWDEDESGDWNVEELRKFLRESLKLRTKVLPDLLIPPLFNIIDCDKDGKISLPDLHSFAGSRRDKQRRKNQNKPVLASPVDSPLYLIRITVAELKKRHVYKDVAFENLLTKKRATLLGPRGSQVMSRARSSAMSRANSASKAGAQVMRSKFVELVSNFDVVGKHAEAIYDLVFGSEAEDGFNHRGNFHIFWQLGDTEEKAWSETVLCPSSVLQEFSRHLRSKFDEAASAFQVFSVKGKPIGKSEFLAGIAKLFKKASRMGSEQQDAIFSSLDTFGRGGDGTVSKQTFQVFWRCSSEVPLIDPENDLYTVAKPLMDGSMKGNHAEREQILAEVAEWIDEHQASGELNWSGPGTPLECAVKSCNVDLVRLLLQRGVDSSVSKHLEKKQVSVMHLAAFSGSTEVCHLLCAVRIDVNSLDTFGQTPLFFACSPEICDLLVRNNADIDVINDHGQSCLHLAAKAGSLPTLGWLACRCKKALLLLKDRYGASAAYYGAHAQPPIPKEILKRLQLHAPSRSLPPRRGRSALNYTSDIFDPHPVDALEHREVKRVAAKSRSNLKNKMAELPPWLARRLAKQDYEVAKDSYSQRFKRPVLDQEIISQLRAKIKAACFNKGDGSVENLALLLQDHDIDGSGELEFQEFRTIMRRTMRISKLVITDEELKGLCSTMDEDGSLGIGIDEFVSFVDPAYGGKRIFSKALDQKLERAQVEESLLSIVRERVEDMADVPDDENDVVPLEVLFRRLDVSGTGCLSIDNVIQIMKHTFDLPGVAIQYEQLRSIFEALKTLDDEIDIDEVMDVLDFDRQYMMAAHKFKAKAYEPKDVVEQNTAKQALKRGTVMKLTPMNLPQKSAEPAEDSDDD